MAATTKIEKIYTPTFSQVVADYSFDIKDKNLELEWIEMELTFAKQQLVTGATTLQRTTIAKLMDLVKKLTLKKELLEATDTEQGIILSNSPDRLEDNPAWRLHQKSQSGFELEE